jgi:hypothetical protein
MKVEKGQHGNKKKPVMKQTAVRRIRRGDQSIGDQKRNLRLNSETGDQTLKAGRVSPTSTTAQEEKNAR